MSKNKFLRVIRFYFYSLLLVISFFFIVLSIPHPYYDFDFIWFDLIVNFP